MKTILVDAVHTFVIPGEGIFKEMHELLENYDNPKIILTSANDEQFATHKLDEMPYPVFTLKHDPEKSDPEYYNRMLRELNLESSNCIYFEHSQDGVATANGVGITTYHYDEMQKDLNALKDFLDSNL